MADTGMASVGADTSIYNKLMGAAGPQQQNPLQMIGQMQQMQGQQIGLDNATLDQAQKHYQFLADRITPVLKLAQSGATPDVISQALSHAATQAVADSNGMIKPDEAMRFVTGVQTFPGGPQAGLEKAMNTTLQGLDRINTMRGNTIATQQGGGTQYSQQDPYSARITPTPGGYIPNTQTVGERMQTQKRVVPDGKGGFQEIAVPNGVAYDPQGNFRQPPQAAPAAQPQPTVPPAPAVVAQPPAPGPSATAATMAPNNFVPQQGFATAAPMGVEDATKRTALASADQGIALQSAADQAPQRKAQLAELEHLLDQTTTGPAAGTMAKAGALANQVLSIAGVDARIPGVGDKEQIKKIVSQMAGQQSQALGGTDASKALASNMNPSLDFSPEGNRKIITMLKGQEDAVAAKAAAWQKYKSENSSADYGAFQQEFNKTFAPRAFAMPYMTAAERAKEFASMSPQEQAQVRQAYNKAVDDGHIPKPSSGAQ